MPKKKHGKKDKIEDLEEVLEEDEIEKTTQSIKNFEIEDEEWSLDITPKFIKKYKEEEFYDEIMEALKTKACEFETSNEWVRSSQNRATFKFSKYRAQVTVIEEEKILEPFSIHNDHDKYEKEQEKLKKIENDEKQKEIKQEAIKLQKDPTLYVNSKSDKERQIIQKAKSDERKAEKGKKNQQKK